jgi:hypothetical protein
MFPSSIPTAQVECDVTVIGIPLDGYVQISDGNSVILNPFVQESSTVRLQQGQLYKRRSFAYTYGGQQVTFGPVHCASPILDVSDSFCPLGVEAPLGGLVAIRNLAQKLEHGDSVMLPSDAIVNWAAVASGQQGGWNSYSILGCMNSLNTVNAFCSLSVVVTVGGTVDITGGPSGQTNGNSLLLPTNIIIEWTPTASGYTGSKATFLVGSCATPLVASNAFCNLKVSVTGGDRIDIQSGPQNVLDKSSILFPKMASIKWRADSSGLRGLWNSYSVGTCAATLVTSSAFCSVVVSVPSSSDRIDIFTGLQDIPGGTVLKLPRGINMSWRADASGFQGSYNLFFIGNCIYGGSNIFDTSSAFCILQISGTSGGKVEISGRSGVLVNGDTLSLPKDITISWRATIWSYFGPYIDHAVGNGGILDASVGFCTLSIHAPNADEIDFSGHVGFLANGDTITLPANCNLIWRAIVNGFTGPYFMLFVGNCGILDTSASVCALSVLVPPNGDEVGIYGLAGPLKQGATVYLPSQINISWRAIVSGFYGSYNSYNVGSCSSPLDTSVGVCSLSLSIPSNGAIDIYGRPGQLTHGSTLNLPSNINISWRAKVNGFNGAYVTYAVGTCASPLDTSAYFCSMPVQIPNNGDSIDIYSYPTPLTNGASITLPANIDILWRPKVSGITGNYITRAVGACSVLDTSSGFCTLTVQVPAGADHIDIDGAPNGYFNNAPVNVPSNGSFLWSAWANGLNGSYDYTRAVNSCVPTNLDTSNGFCFILIKGAHNNDVVDVSPQLMSLPNGSTFVLPANVSFSWRVQQNHKTGVDHLAWASGTGCTELDVSVAYYKTGGALIV